MTRYEQRLQADLDELKARVGAVAERSRRAVDDAVRALLSFDRERLLRVAIDDHPINREIREIDRLCHHFVARHLPAAGHLRFVSSVLRLDIALERIGDYAVTIGRVGAKLDRPLPETVSAGLAELADSTLRMLERANRSFIEGDAALARDTAKLAPKVDRLHDRVFAEMMDQEGRGHVEVVSALTVFGRLERVSDQAKNICEETLFTVLGETKPPKQYPVLFVGPTGALHAPLASALAAKAFPESGRYAAAGFDVAEALDDQLVRAAERLGLHLPEAPVAFAPLRANRAEYHVVVVIGDSIEPLGAVPFHTSVVRWEVEQEPLGQAGLELLARDLAERIRELMELLRGPDAS